ncbi:MAG: ABC transporter substrate-binding protein [Acidisphaera sp.]|nr:ABC transporter substrate-binding protein [Acidisphaera sp.]
MRLALLAALLLAATPALAQKSADTLRIAWRDAIANVDPYRNPLRTGLVLAHQAWDCLVDRDPATFQIKPLLATSWRWIDDTTIEFALRSGVTFHDGSPFSADDVVYTVETVLADKSLAVPSNYLYLAGAEKVDDLHVRLKLRRVFPAALEYIAMTLPILPKAYRERVGPDGYARAPVGTGPYRITKVDGVSEIDLERFANYYPGSPKGRPAIGKLAIREVADSRAELDALLSRAADWIWQFDTDRFDVIARVPELQALRVESMRIGYMSLDAAGRTGAGNPLTNSLVRQAIFEAIDRRAIAAQLAPGSSRALDGPCYPAQFGCDDSAAVRYPYDPARAKQLLVEAGYPDGFKTELVSYVLPQITGAVHTYLAAIGIDAAVRQLQTGEAEAETQAGRTPLYLGSWGSYSINDVSAILPFFFTGGGDDYTRDPEIARLVTEGGATTDTDQRRKYYSEAIHRITEHADWLPLQTYVTTYAISRELNFKPYSDELPRFYLASWR